MTVSELAGDALCQLIREYATDQSKMELLAFWGRHPNAKFSRLAIRSALDWGRVSIDKMLSDMVEAGLVDTHAERGQVLYCLTANESKRQIALGLATLGWARWMSVVREIQGDSPSKLRAMRPPVSAHQ